MNNNTCLTNDLTYSNVMTCFFNSFMNNFSDIFNAGPGSCPQTNLISQSMNLRILPGTDMSNCKINLDQLINLSGKSTCVNLNSLLTNMNETDKKYVIQATIQRSINTLPIVIQNNTSFINKLVSVVLDVLTTPVNENLHLYCSNVIQLTQSQDIILGGSGSFCNNSTFDFSQKAIVSNYINCLLTPFTDLIQNNKELQQSFLSSPNQDCVYDYKVIRPCDGQTRDIQYYIIYPSKGNGTCPVTNSQKQTVNCSESKCQVSEWSTWSDCVNGSQTRSRKMISPGNDCPSFIETRICNLNDNNNYTSDITNNTDQLESNKYKWLTDGLQNFTKRDLVVVFLILLLFTILLVLYLR